ncbi:MAG: ferritin family protein [Candidatus Cloacimonas sp.]|nr:ferritin family protein [Candidatus Cloacimonadota bacterium]
MATFSINEIIEMAAQIEKCGYAYYDNALKQSFLSKEAKELLTMLRDQELKHEKYFNSLRDEEEYQVMLADSDWETVSSYLKAIIRQRIFSTEDAAINLATNAKTEKEILENAINFEKDTILYFMSIKDSITDSRAKEVLDIIIKEEVDHVLKLTLYRDKNLS